MVTQGAVGEGARARWAVGDGTMSQRQAQCGSVVQVVIHYPDPRKVGLVVERRLVAGRQVVGWSRLRNAAGRMDVVQSRERHTTYVWGSFCFARRRMCDLGPGCAEE